MHITFFNSEQQDGLIDGVKIHKFVVHRDSTGSLMETLRSDWQDVFFEPNASFGQSYYSITPPGIARDENQWHMHPTKQSDRFLILSGNAVVALYDTRQSSPTKGKLNLFLMGEGNNDRYQYLLFIPMQVLHGFCAVGSKSCSLLNFPTHLYDPSEEGRIPFSEAGAEFSNGTPFSWDAVREAIKIQGELSSIS